MSNQCWSNVVYFKVEIYNVKQRGINVVYFSVDVNNVRQRPNNVVLFSVEFHKVGQRRNNVGKMIISKKKKKIILNECTEFNYCFITFTLLPILRGIC